jgi:hypothetical protein
MTTTSLHGHIYTVDSLRGVGITPPPAWLELRRRYEALQAAQNNHPMLDRLTKAVLAGGGDIDALWAASVAEQHPAHPDIVLAHVGNYVFPELVKIWAPHARKSYGIIAEKWARTASQFHDCAAAVNVEADADSIVDTDRKGQQCWRDALGLSRQLDELLFPLMCAAALAGAEGDPSNLTFDPAALALPLTVSNLDRLHKRHAWNRWHSLPDDWPPMEPLTRQAYEQAVTPTPPPTPRCGRWSGLISLGAELHAHDKPSELLLATAPKPHHVEWVLNGRGSYDLRRVDPHDGTAKRVKVGVAGAAAQVPE